MRAEQLQSLRQERTNAWIETLAILGLIFGLGLWLRGEDFIWLDSLFNWSVFAPVLIGLRYGSRYAIISMVLLLIGLLMVFYDAPDKPFPLEYWVGMLALAILVGTFRDLWLRKQQKIEHENIYMQERLDEMTRSYHIMKISHDWLEQKLAAHSHSLRSSLINLSNQIGKADTHLVIETHADLLLGFLQQYASFQVAAIYNVDQSGHYINEPLAEIGKMGHLDSHDILLNEAVEHKQLVHIRHDLLMTQEEPILSNLLAVVPILDTAGHCHALLAIKEMPFFALHKQNLQLLAVLCGHIGDMLAIKNQIDQPAKMTELHFYFQCNRCYQDAKQYEIDSALITLTFDRGAKSVQDAIIKTIQTTRRGLDIIHIVENTDASPVILLLMPVTTEDGVMGYQKRIEHLVSNDYQQSLDKMAHFQYQLFSELDDLQTLSKHLTEECQIDSQLVHL